jgi:hypothetical protein
MRKVLVGAGLLATCVGAVAAEWVADGTIEGKSGRLKMDARSKTVLLNNDFGEEYSFHISCVHRTQGWVPPKEIINSKITVDQAAKKVTLSGEYPKIGDDPPTPVEFWYQLTDEGKIRLGFKFKTSADIEKIYRARLHVHCSREGLKEKGVIVDGIVKALLTDPTEKKSLFSGKASEIIYFNDDPARRISFKPVNSGNTYLTDYLSSERLYFELGFFTGKDNSAVIEIDIGG